MVVVTIPQKKPETPKAEQQIEQPTEQNINPEQSQWNMADLNPMSNGNLEVAIKLLHENSNLSQIAVDADAAAVMRRPWDYYGKVIRFTGHASVLQDYPPDNDVSRALGGEACEIVMTAEDSVTIVDGILLGSTQNLYVGDLVTFYGYPCGVMEVDNRIGGKFSHLIVIGTR